MEAMDVLRQSLPPQVTWTGAHAVLATARTYADSDVPRHCRSGEPGWILKPCPPQSRSRESHFTDAGSGYYDDPQDDIVVTCSETLATLAGVARKEDESIDEEDDEMQDVETEEKKGRGRTVKAVNAQARSKDSPGIPVMRTEDIAAAIAVLERKYNNAVEKQLAVYTPGERQAALVLRAFHWGEDFEKQMLYNFVQEFKDHPYLTTFHIGMFALSVMPAPVVTQTFSFVGFSAIGPVAGTAAAHYQSTIGTDAVFRFAQGAAMHGKSLPVAKRIVSGVTTGTNAAVGMWEWWKRAEKKGVEDVCPRQQEASPA